MTEAKPMEREDESSRPARNSAELASVTNEVVQALRDHRKQLRELRAKSRHHVRRR